MGIGIKKMGGGSDKLAFRLAYIISELLCGKKLYTPKLADEFGVSKRTIQRDLNNRLINLSIVFKDGFYYLDDCDNRLKNYELLKFSQKSGIEDLYPSKNFINHLSDSNKKVVGCSYEHVNPNIFKILEICISYSNIAHFIYKQKERNVKPYKLINFNGVWYLIATENSKIKNYAISKIINLRRGNNFKKNQDIENFIEKNSDQFISENLINIKLKVKKEVSEFILRRKIFKGQSAVRHLKNGDLVVEAKVAFLKDFMGMVRYWIPYISILEPIELKNKLLAELEDYIKKEKNVFEKYER